MMDVQEAPTFDPTLMKKKKSRKSVAFAGEDEAEEKTTAEVHSLRMFLFANE